jgi:hypothetical protein
MKRAALLVLGLALGGCDQSMTVQPRYRTYARADLWSDGTEARPLPEHTVAQGDIARDAALATPPPVTAALVARGKERFNI